VIHGAGFDGGAQLRIGGIEVTPISISATDIVAVVPSDLPGAVAQVQVFSGGTASNTVLVPLASLL
jgi:uncharacterized protein (TIGR03437 family)